MARPLVPDDLWAAVSPLLPLEPAKPKGGRPRVPDRAALAGIVFVLRTGIQRRDAPPEMGCGGKTCWRRLVEWHGAGVRAALHQVLLERLRGADRLDWRRASLDSAAVRATRGARRPGPIGRHRWKVERTLAWLAQFRRLAIRHERRADVRPALTTLACAVVCARQIRRFCP